MNKDVINIHVKENGLQEKQMEKTIEDIALRAGKDANGLHLL